MHKSLLTTVAAIAVASSLLFVPTTAAQNVCDDCNIQGLIEEYEWLYKEATRLYMEAAGQSGAAADAYQDALDSAKDLAGLPSLPGDMAGACRMVAEEFSDRLTAAVTALEGLASIVTGMSGESEAQQTLARAQLSAKRARRSRDCRIKCCKKAKAAEAAAKKLLESNPDINFQTKLNRTVIHRCMQNLSPADYSKTIQAAKAGKLDAAIGRTNAAEIAKLPPTK